MEKLPSLSAVAVPKMTVPLKRVTVEPASAVPVIVGVESFVIEEIEARAEGATGGVVSMAMEIGEDIEEVLPAASTDDAVIE